MKKIKLNITGMTCSSCSSHVEKAVNKLEGIQTANVNLLSNNMVAEFDEDIITSDEIIKAIVSAGYGASIADDTDTKKENKKEEKIDNNNIIKSMKNRLITSIIFLIPLMYLAMYHMFNHWFGLPIPNIINNLFSGEQNAINFSFTQLLLVLPIVYINRNYFIIGYKRLFKRSPNMDSLIAIGSSAAIVYGIYAIYMIGYGLRS